MPGKSPDSNLGTIRKLNIGVALAATMIVVAVVVVGVVAGGGGDVGFAAYSVAMAVLGCALVVRVSDRLTMGWLMILIGITGAIAGAAFLIPVDMQALRIHAFLQPWFNFGFLSLLGLTIAILPLLFPTGRPPSLRWRWVLWLGVAGLVGISILAIFYPFSTVSCSDQGQMVCAEIESARPDLTLVCGPEESAGEVFRGCEVELPNPIGISWMPHPEEGPVSNIIIFGMFLPSMILGIVSLAVRFRRSVGIERQQIKWFLAACGLLFLWVIFGVVTEDLDAVAVAQIISGILQFIALVSIPIAIYIAVSRYRLYEIDRLVSRSVSYLVVVGLLAGVYLGLVALLSVFVPSDNPVIVAASTLVVAALFNPVRKRVQSWVDRRFNRSRYDAERVMEGFVGSLRDRVEVGDVVDGWVGVVSETMQPSTIGVWIRE
ncbi:MAG TPA: hypothetical protein VIW94_03390 [Acidimicrobiia bacterium]